VFDDQSQNQLENQQAMGGSFVSDSSSMYYGSFLSSAGAENQVLQSASLKEMKRQKEKEKEERRSAKMKQRGLFNIEDPLGTIKQLQQLPRKLLDNALDKGA